MHCLKPSHPPPFRISTAERFAAPQMRMPVWTHRAEPKPARQPPSQGRVKSSAEPAGQIPESGLDKKRSELLPVCPNILLRLQWD
ncbi:hypothetical protein AOLI_G00012940 [Acnodon oligacanthus]